MTGRVAAVNISEKKGQVKKPVDRGMLVKDLA